MTEKIPYKVSETLAMFQMILNGYRYEDAYDLLNIEEEQEVEEKPKQKSIFRKTDI